MLAIASQIYDYLNLIYFFGRFSITYLCNYLQIYVITYRSFFAFLYVDELYLQQYKGFSMISLRISNK
jgi:hypothetical protein